MATLDLSGAGPRFWAAVGETSAVSSPTTDRAAVQTTASPARPALLATESAADALSQLLLAVASYAESSVAGGELANLIVVNGGDLVLNFRVSAPEAKGECLHGNQAILQRHSPYDICGIDIDGRSSNVLRWTTDCTSCAERSDVFVMPCSVN